MDFTVDKSQWEKVKRQLLLLDNAELRIGWFDTSYGADNDNLPHATVAALNEYGHTNGAGSLFPGTQTPPRPFMRVGFRDYMKSNKSVPNFQKIINNVLKGQTALRSYGSVGPVFVRALQGVMDAWDSPPNSRITQELKGFNNPLVKTHELIDNVSFDVGSA
jgi:hypothetical protein